MDICLNNIIDTDILRLMFINHEQVYLYDMNIPPIIINIDDISFYCQYYLYDTETCRTEELYYTEIFLADTSPITNIQVIDADESIYNYLKSIKPINKIFEGEIPQ